MANVLVWKDDEGYDIHVLRGEAPSKPLDESFVNLDPDGLALAFDSHFKGAPNNPNLGVAVNSITGEVTAAAQPSPPRFPNFNFLVTARQTLVGDKLEALIRIHIHDNIDKIWLTPATLTIHTHSDDCRFTVLALFSDGVVGDITDWPQVTLTSANKNSVDILPDGRLSATPGRSAIEMEIEITATVNLTSSQHNATAKAVTKANWGSLGATAVQFVDGPVRPNPNDLKGVQSIVETRTNVLFISEGFLQSPPPPPSPPRSAKPDFDKAVDILVKTGLPDEVLQPFKLLKDSINYWSLFVPSQDDGISLLGDYTSSIKRRGGAVERPEEPTPGATQWSVENMIHQLGLPVPKDPARSIPDWVTYWNQLYDTQVTAQLVQFNFSDWDLLRSRSPLNERDTAFGFAYGTRARVTGTAVGDPQLRPAPRRTTEASLDDFIKALSFGVAPPGGNPVNIGKVWTQGGKDRGLVCFVCLSDVGPGEAREGYFAAATGFETAVNLISAPKGGTDFLTAALSDPKAPYSPDIYASRVAHECAHALGLGDEYGPGSTAMFTPASADATSFPNLQAKDAITTSSGSQTVFHPDKIKWLLPRAIKVGLMLNAPLPQGNDFQMQLAPGHGTRFAVKDLVLLRQPPVNSDPFAKIRFKVVQVFADAVDVTQMSGPPLDVSQYDTNKMHVFICASDSANPDVELKLVAGPVLNHIGTSAGPLNAPAGNAGAACVPAKNAAPFMTPTNLPTLKFKKKPPPATADVVGIYEGGGHFDCGVVRPAGRCKMRTSDDMIVPFCQVCRYIIVDRVDAMKLAELDSKQYDPYYPI
jgi:hypothetical protein